MPQKTFKVIVSDPPWPFKDTLKMSDVPRGAEANYKVMTMQDIKNLPMKDFADPDGCVLALWVPSSLLQDGLDTMKAWGFDHKQTYIWVKTKKNPLGELFKYFIKQITKDTKDLGRFNIAKMFITAAAQFKYSTMLGFGMGRLFRQTHEIALIGTRGKKIYASLKNKSQRSVSMAPNLRHSAKPDDLQKSLEEMFPDGDKLEMFARRHLSGWTCIGNEICGGEDITESLAKL